MRKFALAAALCLVVLGLGFAGQTSVGTVTGVVQDDAGAPVRGAAVRLTAAGAASRTTVSDMNGAFTFERTPVAEYELSVSLHGFAAYRTRVSVRVGRTTRVPVVLHPGSSTEQALAQPDPVAPEVASLPRRAAETLAQAFGGIARSTAPTHPAAPGASADWVRPRGGHVAPNTEAYDRIDDNPFRSVTKQPLSTFSIDVDTASYANVRRHLSAGTLPPADAVRIEELINYFRFEYPAPATDAPFSVTTELAPCPWNPQHRLALIGLQARPIETDSIPARNLVFLLDVSGSMETPDKLPLVKTAMRMLVNTLTSRDRIAIVVYAGASGMVLPPTSGAHKERLHDAIARLEAGGSTNGGEGIALAYQVAREQFVKGGINRVILATDGDFNVGVTSEGDLTRLIEEKRASGIFLSVLGVGTGNVKDSTMEKLADRGNGNYAYLDTVHEARKVLVREAGATLVTVAKDVKMQVEFNPVNVAAYRLIGYENRVLASEDFNDDRKDAGEIGAGHTVTALYEIVPAGVKIDIPGVDPLKYQRPVATAPDVVRDELMTLKLRYKKPDGDESRLVTLTVKNRETALSANTGFAAAVAGFGMLLRHSEHRGAATYDAVAALARRFKGTDPDGYRAEFVRLVETAQSLTDVHRHQ